MHGFERNEAGKLFVGGLSWDTTKDSLLQYFSQYGEVVDCIVMKNQETGKSRGFGFVTYRDTSCVEIVLSVPSHIVDGRQVDPKACNPKGQQRGVGGDRPDGGGGPMGDGQRNNRGPRGGGGPHGDKKIFLGGLPNSADEGAIRKFFSQYGKVLEVTVMYDNQKQRSRGFGFLTFESEDAVNAVCREHYVNFNGKKVECKRATPRSQGGNEDSQQIPVSMPHPGAMPHMEMGMHPPPQQHQPPGPDPQWASQEPQWNPQMQQSPPPQVGAPGQYPQAALGQLQAQYQPDQPAGVPPGWPQQQPAPGPGGWPPGSVPPQQPGAAPGSTPFLAQQPAVTVAYSSTQTFQSPPGAPVYQYAASPPGAPPQQPPANGQLPPNAALGQAPSSYGYTAPSYAAPNVAVPQNPAAVRPGYQEFTGSHIQVASSLAPAPGTPTAISSAAAYSVYPSPYGAPAPVGSIPQPVVGDPYAPQTGVAPPGGAVQVAGAPMGAPHPAGQTPGIPAAAYGSTPLAQAQVVGSADPAAPKAVDYSSYYSAYGYTVEAAPGASASASAAYGAQPTPAPAQVQAPSPAQPPYGSPEAVPQVAYAAAPGPSPTFQRQGSGQSYHPYARR